MHKEIPYGHPPSSLYEAAVSPKPMVFLSVRQEPLPSIALPRIHETPPQSSEANSIVYSPMVSGRSIAAL